MFVTAKLKLLSGMVIGAGAVMVMTKMCKQRRKHRRSAPVTAGLSPRQGVTTA